MMHQLPQVCRALTDTNEVLEETMFGNFVALRQTTTKNWHYKEIKDVNRSHWISEDCTITEVLVYVSYS